MEEMCHPVGTLMYLVKEFRLYFCEENAKFGLYDAILCYPASAILLLCDLYIYAFLG